MRTETKKEAIARLKKEGYEKLYVVDCYITDTRAKASTWLWNIYANIEDALRWPKLCEDYHRRNSKVFCGGYSDEFEDRICVYSYCDGATGQPVLLEQFKLSVM